MRKACVPQSNTLKQISMGYSRDSTPCQWGRVAVVVWTGDGCNISGWGRANAVATLTLEY